MTFDTSSINSEKKLKINKKALRRNEEEKFDKPISIMLRIIKNNYNLLSDKVDR